MIHIRRRRFKIPSSAIDFLIRNHGSQIGKELLIYQQPKPINTVYNDT